MADGAQHFLDSFKDPAAVGEFVARLMVEGFDSTAFHALPKVMEKA